ncbi:5-methyltetrahydropteroyltriglutamate--homocysteine methyltransferase-like [Dorcoceras hygrometricum]|uniref:5-methyltetrahydropteroyltriglutamate--homocysteine methyltransferase-like n=1 Tax=Dorcoceras hygrometricum TaxID=472368 RepID=A0A2Z7A256_9LAMI|nr:5-methyltetrahydropteroyltriglutamate--homocysteine methyltransferase-like [Dorcoceras hygrometricum]
MQHAINQVMKCMRLSKESVIKTSVSTSKSSQESLYTTCGVSTGGNHRSVIIEARQPISQLGGILHLSDDSVGLSWHDTSICRHNVALSQILVLIGSLAKAKVLQLNLTFTLATASADQSRHCAPNMLSNDAVLTNTNDDTLESPLTVLINSDSADQSRHCAPNMLSNDAVLTNTNDDTLESPLTNSAVIALSHS